jgi:hypothetical protein
MSSTRADDRAWLGYSRLVRALVALAGVVVSAAVPVAHWVDFRTPSRNIICTTGVLPSTNRTVGIDCVVLSASGSHGQASWMMRPTGRAWHRSVAANIETGGLHVLAYGRSWSRLGISCTSRSNGLTCRNRSSHGFFLSRERQRIF